MKLITPKEAARVIGCTASNIYALIYAGKVRQKRQGTNGHYVLVSEVDVRKYASTEQTVGRPRTGKPLQRVKS